MIHCFFVEGLMSTGVVWLHLDVRGRGKGS